MSRAIVLQHVAYEGPARIAALLAERNYQLDVRALHRADPIPERLAQGELLIVMGGPMGVGELDDPSFPFLRREVELLRRCVQEGSPVLGVCLGSQLLAHAAGAAVYPLHHGGSRSYEVGWAPITVERTDDPLFGGIPGEMWVLHWHGDTFDLPPGAVRLASSALCPNQAFRVGRRAFGLQFHCETSAEDVAAWIAADTGFMAQANGADAAATIRRDTTRFMPQQLELGGRLLRNILDAMTLS